MRGKSIPDMNRRWQSKYCNTSRHLCRSLQTGSILGSGYDITVKQSYWICINTTPGKSPCGMDCHFTTVSQWYAMGKQLSGGFSNNSLSALWWKTCQKHFIVLNWRLRGYQKVQPKDQLKQWRRKKGSIMEMGNSPQEDNSAVQPLACRLNGIIQTRN